MKKIRCAVFAALVWAMLFSFSCASGETAFRPGQDVVLMDQSGIQVMLKGDSFSAGFEETAVRLKAEIRNESGQDAVIWYTGTVNGHELSPEGWYLCLSPAQSVSQAVIANQQPVLTLTDYGDLTALQLHFEVYGSNAALWFEADSDKILFEPALQRDIQAEVDPDTDYAAYQSGEIISFLESLPADMETVTTDASEDMMRLRLSNRTEPQMIRSFAVLSPSATADEIDALLSDAPQSADNLAFDMYVFQRKSLGTYTDRQPIDQELLGSLMPECWQALKGLDFAAGFARDGEAAYYWMPVFYEAGDQSFLADEVYLYVCAVYPGADRALLDEMGVYDPAPGDYRTEQFLITDRESVARLLALMQQENDLWTADANQNQYGTLGLDSAGEGVRAIQKRLSDLGFMSSSVDGIYGPLTQDAVAAFQEAKGLNATGTADAETQWILLAEQDERTRLQAWFQRCADESAR